MNKSGFSYTFRKKSKTNKTMSKTVSCPSTVIHVGEDKTYMFKRLEELGHGGFATVYRVIESSTNQEYALKVVSKERVSKPKSLEKMKSEISIQSSLHHPNIVQSFLSFEDSLNYYIIIEYCPGHSIRDIIKKQRRINEDEVSKMLKDVIEGVSYLHDNRVIHRDIKLENFLIGADGKVKIADFGLSAKLDYDDQKKFTVCGTPNYISPELLTSAKEGHSYEVDIWAIGVCAYAMLYGKPPFETAKTKLTYEHIKQCSYSFPSEPKVSSEAKDFIKKILQIKPELRPTAQELLFHPFITHEKIEDIPAPVSAPKPRFEKENIDTNALIPRKSPVRVPEITMPKYCVSRFCDHSDKYGLGYLLIDGTVGACFNDLSRMIMDPYEEFIQYWDTYQTREPLVYTLEDNLEPKKQSILLKFADSLKKTKTMFTLPTERYDPNKPMRHVKYWTRNADATLFRMDDREIQVNFADRVKIVIFWSQKKMLMVHSIKESNKLVEIGDIDDGCHQQEKERFHVAKLLLTQMCGK